MPTGRRTGRKSAATRKTTTATSRRSPLRILSQAEVDKATNTTPVEEDKPVLTAPIKLVITSSALAALRATQPILVDEVKKTRMLIEEDIRYYEATRPPMPGEYVPPPPSKPAPRPQVALDITTTPIVSSGPWATSSNAYARYPGSHGPNAPRPPMPMANGSQYLSPYDITRDISDSPDKLATSSASSSREPMENTAIQGGYAAPACTVAYLYRGRGAVVAPTTLAELGWTEQDLIDGHATVDQITSTSKPPRPW